MTKRIAAVVMMIGAMTMFAGLPGMAAPNGHSVKNLAAQKMAMKNQFHVRPAKGQSKFADRIAEEFAARMAEQPNRPALTLPARGQAKSEGKCDVSKPMAPRVQARAGRNLKSHAQANPAPTTIGFVSASQVAAGGDVSTNQALEGDFNGDGKNDLMTVVINSVCGSNVISVAVSLGNGDGTFQTPVLTPVPSNSMDAFVAGDLGNGTDDVVIVHLPGSLGPGAPASFDVMLSNGDGSFTVGNNYVITASQLAGGILYDVNGDGKLDAVIVDAATPGNVWTLLGNGDGTFQPATSVALAGRAGSNVVFADFNGDGLLDFADNDYVTGELTVY